MCVPRSQARALAKTAGCTAPEITTALVCTRSVPAVLTPLAGLCGVGRQLEASTLAPVAELSADNLEQTDRQTDGQTDRQTGRQADGQSVCNGIDRPASKLLPRLPPQQ